MSQLLHSYWMCKFGESCCHHNTLVLFVCVIFFSFFLVNHLTLIILLMKPPIKNQSRPCVNQDVEWANKKEISKSLHPFSRSSGTNTHTYKVFYWIVRWLLRTQTSSNVVFVSSSIYLSLRYCNNKCFTVYYSWNKYQLKKKNST